MRKVHTTSVTQRVVPEVSPSRQTQAFPNSTSGTNTGVTPEDMLSFLNSNTFSTYQSNSSSPSTLFGKDVGLAVSALTHESWMYGAQGHNRRLAFLGRRALKTYLSLYFFAALNQAERSETIPEHEVRFLRNTLSSPHGVDRYLRTQDLGDHVGRALQLEKVMRWQPAAVCTCYLTQNLDSSAGTQQSGLFKVRGTCVEAITGAIYHGRVCRIVTDNQGAQVAQQFFHSRIMPNLDTLLKEAPESIRQEISQTSQKATEALQQSP
ncbi:hypothetical protein MYAM1_002009 [Malassezia yamatoensis]|uniref:RNase III domain-containing protein n=1 Tax=Malassezia yamatoensis TaxID=253288 RepID=A0AAJ6CHE8_9BASI|nr:hypothetical protein MYAM1_002009 [Malassezia yamatoensis]